MRFCSLVVECSLHYRMVVGSIPTTNILRCEFYGVTVKVSTFTSTDPGSILDGNICILELLEGSLTESQSGREPIYFEQRDYVCAVHVLRACSTE